MAKNKLQLNDKKTEVITFSSKYRPTADKISLQMGDACISSVSCVKDLGVLLDKFLTMEDQVKHICRVAYYQLRNIANIRRYLTPAATKSLVHSLVTSRLDYCNSLLVGLPGALQHKLQMVQNTAARVITRTAKYDHISPVLRELHWLPVARRIQYKILLYVHKAVHGNAPIYIKDLLQVKAQQRTLRSNNSIQLHVHPTHTRTYGDRSFKKAAPTMWNQLPGHMRNIKAIDSFKCALKTHLFISEFN